jgi:Protein of unknown function (DUF3352)
MRSAKPLVALAACTLLFAWSAAPVVAATPGKYLPDNTEVVFSVDIHALLESGAVKRNFEKELTDALSKAEVAQILQLIGLDPRKDIGNLTMCFGKIEAQLGGGAQPKGEVLGIVHGKFSAEKIHSVLAQAINSDKKLGVSEHNGVKVYEMKDNDKTVYAALVDEETIVGSDKKSNVTDAIDKSKGKSSGKVSKEFAAILDKADSKKTVWAAMVVPGALKDLAKLDPRAGNIVDKTEGLTFGISVADGIKSEIKIYTTDEGVAGEVRQGLEAGKGYLGVGVLSLKEYSGLLLPVINNIKIADEKGKVASVSVEVDAATIEKLAKKVKGSNDK